MLRLKIATWLRGIYLGLFGCHKEQLGYRCRHRVYEDGFKECGD